MYSIRIARYMYNCTQHTHTNKTIFWISWFGTWNADINLRYAMQTKPYGKWKFVFTFCSICLVCIIFLSDVFVIAVWDGKFIDA